jgi:hypothetical protein
MAKICKALCDRDRDITLRDGQAVCMYCDLHRRECEARSWIDAYIEREKLGGAKEAQVWWRRILADIEHHRGKDGVKILLFDIREENEWRQKTGYQAGDKTWD